VRSFRVSENLESPSLTVNARLSSARCGAVSSEQRARERARENIPRSSKMPRNPVESLRAIPLAVSQGRPPRPQPVSPRWGRHTWTNSASRHRLDAREAKDRGFPAGACIRGPSHRSEMYFWTVNRRSLLARGSALSILTNGTRRSGPRLRPGKVAW
jgi:hypothetical protein